MVFITRVISMTNFLVASSALGFQVFVLYPWHKELDAGFEELKKEHLKVLGAVSGGPGISRKEGQAMQDKLSELQHSHNRSDGATIRIYTPHTAVRLAKQAASESSIFQTASIYGKYAAAGAFCCSFTHAVLTPVDVVKTRIQLKPYTYGGLGIAGTVRHIAASEGASALLTGFGPTMAGYALQGGFKFGGYEIFKHRCLDYLGHELATEHRNAVYLASSAAAEVLGDLALCPFEAVRIRLVSNPSYARGLLTALKRMTSQEGVAGLYSGLGPILLKQVPYTMATFLVYEKTIQVAYGLIGKSSISSAGATGVNTLSGLVAGIAAAVVSHPADTILSTVNKEQPRYGEGSLARLIRIARDLGLRQSFTGLRARIVMVGGMTAIQFAIYGDVKKAFGAHDEAGL